QIDCRALRTNSPSQSSFNLSALEDATLTGQRQEFVKRHFRNRRVPRLPDLPKRARVRLLHGNPARAESSVLRGHSPAGWGEGLAGDRAPAGIDPVAGEARCGPA